MANRKMIPDFSLVWLQRSDFFRVELGLFFNFQDSFNETLQNSTGTKLLSVGKLSRAVR